MLAKEHGVDDEVLVNLLLIEEIDAKKMPLINAEKEAVKHMYWKAMHHNYKAEEQICRFVLEEKLKYADQVAIIGALRECIKYFLPTEILSIMEALRQNEVGEINSLTSYSLKEILRKLQDEYCNIAECCGRVAQLELSYRGLLEWEDMVCFKRCLEMSPKLFAEMISIIYKKDDVEEEVGNKSDGNLVRSISSLYHDAIFCPAETNGIVDKVSLFVWIAEFKELLKI